MSLFCTGGAPAAATKHLCCWGASRYIRAVSARLAGGILGKGDLSRQPWQLSTWRLGWKDMLLLLALVGPAGDLENALLCSCLQWYVAYCV